MKLVKDLKAFSNGSKKKAITTIITNPCFHSICLYRLSSWFYKLHLTCVSKILWYFNRMIFHIDLDYRSELAGGLVIKHGLGIVIGKDVESKGMLTIYQGVTLGGCGKTRPYKKRILRQPLLMEDVIIYTDAKILGPVIIGKNNRIKAGQIISTDIPDWNGKNE